jgi:phosphatidylglycerol:prolipoprotein diacylglycerol transferase
VTLTTLTGAHLAYRALRSGDGPGGLASMGGVAGLVAGIVVSAWLLRARIVDLLDAFAPAALLALGLGRLGCFLAGCCHGAPTTLPWGVVMPAAGPLPRHPLQLYSAVIDVGLAGWLLRAPRMPGSVARRACVGFGLARFALELLRDPATTIMLPGDMLTLPQAGCLVLVVTGLVAGTGLVRLPQPVVRRNAGVLRR